MPFAILLLLPVFWSCSSGPQPIAYGKDECAFCKMTIMEAEFGCQIVNTKGKHFNFDDISCMTGYLETGVIAAADIAERYVPDYAAGHRLLPAASLFYVKSERLHSPMGGNVAGFMHKDSAVAVASKLGGQLVSWTQLEQSK